MPPPAPPLMPSQPAALNTAAFGITVYQSQKHTMWREGGGSLFDQINPPCQPAALNTAALGTGPVVDKSTDLTKYWRINVEYQGKLLFAASLKFEDNVRRV